MVAVYDTFRFKHIGAFQGIPPTGKEATMTSTDIYRIVDGKIVEQWVEANLLSPHATTRRPAHARARWRVIGQHATSANTPQRSASVCQRGH
jgi:hypothetical protein